MFSDIQDIMTKVFDSIRSQHKASEERVQRAKDQRDVSPSSASSESSALQSKNATVSDEKVFYEEESRLIAPSQKPLDFRGFKLDHFV